MPLLELDSLAAGYGRVEAIEALTLHVENGEIVALLGANGAGKSTTLRAIAGLLKPRKGTIRFDGRSIEGMAPEAIVRLGIALVPEGRRIFAVLNLPTIIPIPQAERVLDLFPEIRPAIDAPGWTLSGGQQQMAAIARGLMARPRLLLLDEPSLGLAPLIVDRVFRVLARLAANGTAILLVEQNARMALWIAARGYVLAAGRLAVAGSATELAHDDAVRAAYLGGASDATAEATR